MKTPDPFKTDPDRNFPEDYNQENGNYINKCVYCENFFRGNKHRNSCKKCDNGSIEFFTSIVTKTKKPEDNKCAHAGCWSQGEMVGYAKCMLDKVFPSTSQIEDLTKDAKYLKESLNSRTGKWTESIEEIKRLKSEIEELSKENDDLHNSLLQRTDQNIDLTKEVERLKILVQDTKDHMVTPSEFVEVNRENDRYREALEAVGESSFLTLAQDIASSALHPLVKEGETKK